MNELRTTLDETMHTKSRGYLVRCLGERRWLLDQRAAALVDDEFDHVDKVRYLPLHVGAAKHGEELRIAREEEQVEALADVEPVVAGQDVLPRLGYQLAVDVEQASVLGRFL
jgi:hypothetical protein